MLHPTHLPAHLCAATLRSPAAINKGVAVPLYDRGALACGIVHIGVGNFHRVHQAMAIDRCLHLPDHAGWAICGVGLGDGAGTRAKAQAFQRQDCLYSVAELAPDGAARAYVIGAMTQYLHAPGNPQAVLASLADPATRIVSLTITEGGYNIDEASGAFRLDAPEVAAELADGVPRSAFGYIVMGLRRRRLAGLGGFTVLSCDNLRHNGATARRAVLAFAEALDPELAGWIAAHVSFPNSMVDRIAPTVSERERERSADLLGVADAVPAICEPYCEWVIEDDFCAGRPQLEAAGVTFTHDVAAYEEMKGRLLNASHMLLAYPALLCGHRLVHEAMRDPQLSSLLAQFMETDVTPRLRAPAGVALGAYRHKVMERFGNAAVADQLLRVAHDGAAKIPVFHSKTITQMIEDGADMRRIALLLACFRLYCRCSDQLGIAFEVLEPQLGDADRLLLADADPLAMLEASPFAALQLNAHVAFRCQFSSLCKMIEQDGLRAALAWVIC